MQELLTLAKDRIRLVKADGSTCGLCDRPITRSPAAAIGVVIPVLGRQDKHFCPRPCMEIIAHRINAIVEQTPR